MHQPISLKRRVLSYQLQVNSRITWNRTEQQILRYCLLSPLSRHHRDKVSAYTNACMPYSEPMQICNCLFSVKVVFALSVYMMGVSQISCFRSKNHYLASWLTLQMWEIWVWQSGANYWGKAFVCRLSGNYWNPCCLSFHVLLENRIGLFVFSRAFPNKYFWGKWIDPPLIYGQPSIMNQLIS